MASNLRAGRCGTWVMGHQVYNKGQFNTDRFGQEAHFDHSRGGYWATT